MSPYNTKILDANPESLSEAKALLKQGKIVALPSETVYGLAGDAFNPEACALIFAAKKRPAFDPLIIHVAKSWSDLKTLDQKGVIDISIIPDSAQEKLQMLMHKFWPGPLTVVLPRGRKVPDIVTNGLMSVAVRMPAHAVFQQILESSQFALAAPSANLFSHVSPTTAQHVFDDLSGTIPLIIDGGPCGYGVESTILGFDENFNPLLLRRGALSESAILSTGGWKTLKSIAHDQVIAAPGMLERHYAPTRPLFLSDLENKWNIPDNFNASKKQLNAALVSLFADAPGVEPNSEIFLIKERCSLSTSLKNDADGLIAAKNLFSLLRNLERADIDVILVESPKTTQGLWAAVQDRLWKARYQGATKHGR